MTGPRTLDELCSWILTRNRYRDEKAAQAIRLWANRDRMRKEGFWNGALFMWRKAYLGDTRWQRIRDGAKQGNKGSGPQQETSQGSG